METWDVKGNTHICLQNLRFAQNSAMGRYEGGKLHFRAQNIDSMGFHTWDQKCLKLLSGSESASFKSLRVVSGATGSSDCPTKIWIFHFFR